MSWRYEGSNLRLAISGSYSIGNCLEEIWRVLWNSRVEGRILYGELYGEGGLLRLWL